MCHGAEVNKNDRWGGTPIRDAEAGGHRSVVEYLERNGAIRRPSRVEDESVPSPDDLVDMTGKLCDAARNGDVVKLRELLDAGAEVCRGDYDNRTALHLGAAEGHLAAVKYLVARGADVNAVDRWRGTPLRDAEAGEHTDTVAFLKRVGAVNRRSASSLIDTPDSLSRSVWKSTSELGFLRITLVILHAIEQTQLRRQHRDDGVGRLKFDFHTGRGRALPHRSRRPPPARSGGASPSRRSEARRSRRRPRRLHQLVSSSGRRRAAAAIATQ